MQVVAIDPSAAFPKAIADMLPHAGSGSIIFIQSNLPNRYSPWSAKASVPTSRSPRPHHRRVVGQPAFALRAQETLSEGPGKTGQDPAAGQSHTGDVARVWSQVPQLHEVVADLTGLVLPSPILTKETRLFVGHKAKPTPSAGCQPSSKPLNVELFQDDVCLRCGDFRAPAKVDENELPKFRYVMSSDTYKEIMSAGDKKNIPHLSHVR
jgi:hypothetical protein